MLALPFFCISQTWSKEEQAFLDNYQKKFDQLSNKPITWEHWIAVVRPDDDLTIWDIIQGMQSNLNAEKTWHLNAVKQGLVANNSHFRPIKIIMEGELTLLWYYEYNSRKDNTGKIFDSEEKTIPCIQTRRCGMEVSWRYGGPSGCEELKKGLLSCGTTILYSYISENKHQ